MSAHLSTNTPLSSNPHPSRTGASRILIAGCGDLGQRCAALLDAHEEVGAVYGLRRHPPVSSGHAIHWVRGDVADPASLAGLPVGITHVLYALTPGERTEEAYRRVYLDGLRHVVRALDAGALRRIVFVSSSAVYGDHGGQWIDENTPTAPQAFNGRILVDAENWLHALGQSTTSLRLAGLYGPGREQLLARIREGRAQAPSDDEHWANRIHVDDAAHACVHLLMRDEVEPVYIGCDDTPLPLRTLYESLARLLAAPPVPQGDAPAQVGNKRLCNARLRASGWRPRFPDSREGYRTLV